jgi:hypothetical protein
MLGISLPSITNKEKWSMTNLNRIFPVFSEEGNDYQIGWGYIDHGKVAIIFTSPMIAALYESRVEAEDVTKLYLDWELKSFADRKPIRGSGRKNR